MNAQHESLQGSSEGQQTPKEILWIVLKHSQTTTKNQVVKKRERCGPNITYKHTYCLVRKTDSVTSRPSKIEYRIIGVSKTSSSFNRNNFLCSVRRWVERVFLPSNHNTLKKTKPFDSHPKKNFEKKVTKNQI